jgi:hypothetical protein
MIDLEKYIKKYIWDDERTPYLVPVARMTRRQADYELHAYTVFVGVLFAIVSGSALLSQDPQIKSDAVAVYGFTVVCATVVFGFTRSVYAAWYCAGAPLVALMYFFVLPSQSENHRPRRADHLCARLAALLAPGSGDRARLSGHAGG